MGKRHDVRPRDDHLLRDVRRHDGDEQRAVLGPEFDYDAPIHVLGRGRAERLLPAHDGPRIRHHVARLRQGGVSKDAWIKQTMIFHVVSTPIFFLHCASDDGTSFTPWVWYLQIVINIVLAGWGFTEMSKSKTK